MVSDPRKWKFNLHYTRDITLKRVKSGGVHLHDLAPGQHRHGSDGELLTTLCAIWRVREANPTPPADSNVFHHCAKSLVLSETYISEWFYSTENFLFILLPPLYLIPK